MSMSIPECYLKTDLGIIPNDWDVKELEKVVKVIDGDRGNNYPSNDELYNSGYCLFLSAKNVTKEGFKFLECIFITKDKDSLLGKGKLVKRDVVLTTRGTVGNIAFFDDSVPFENIRINSGMVILRSDNKNLDTTYLYIFFKSHLFQNQIDKVVFGSAQPQLTVKSINKLKIALPSTKEEQKAIAQSLSDVDTLITALDQVITKKRNIKQGTMQQVLTGKKRLPGFIGEWEVKTLGELGCPGRPAIKAGPFGSSLKKEFYVEKGYKIYGQEQVIAGDLSIGNYYIDSYLFEKLKSCEIRPNDILISLVGTFGKVIVVPDNIERGIINPRLLRLSLDSNWVYPYFLQYWLISSATQKLLSETSHGGTMGIINAKVLSVLSILLPLIPEQQAIAQILSDIEAEIEALEKKRDKYKAIKQGMMQELLTGKTRLINS
jgi:type I restriction enzyme S subunit